MGKWYLPLKHIVSPKEICDIVHTIRDVVDYVPDSGQKGIVLALDFNKAFDRVEHTFLFKVLEAYCFGRRLVNLVRLIYRNAKGKVKFNGVLTDGFTLSRSVRQGCPLSAMLYSIVAEPLATLIKADKRIRGIDLPNGKKCTIQQFADDTTIMVKDFESIKSVLGILDVYGSAAGAQINIEKSEIMCINMSNPLPLSMPWKICDRFMKILGTYVGVDKIAARDETWSKVINKIQKCLNFWKMRDLHVIGKIKVVNNLVLSKINFALATTALPKWALNRLDDIVTDFVWGAKKR